MEMFRPKNWLDRIFAVSIILKGLDGLGETIGGLLLLFVTPHEVNRTVRILTREELTEDPHDFLATHLVAAAHRIGTHDLLFVALYLLAHGVIKVVLVVALLLNRLWAYPWLIVVLIAFIGYQLYEIAVHPTAGLIALTLFDAFIVVLTWREYRTRRRRQPSRP
jgi:uncharacterized membrane protein